MPMAGGTTTAPPGNPPHMRRSDDDDDRNTTAPLLESAGDGGWFDGLCDQENISYYVNSCLYFFFCHAVDSVLLHICCCRCFKSHLTHPEELEPKNKPQKAYAFCMKVLSNLWASALLLFVVRWAFLRPFDVQPMLGVSVVNQFDLLQSHSATAGDHYLRFNFTTHLLFKNSHYYYSLSYDHPAAAVFYAGEKLGPVDDAIPPFKQEPLHTMVVDQVVAGRLPNASSIVVGNFLRERVQGRFEMVMRIRVTLSYKYWPFKEEYFTLYDCPLSSPVPQIGKPALSTQALCNTVKM